MTIELRGKKIHFAGIGGIGVSAVAQIAAEKGAIVSGCDIRENRCFRALVERGFDCSVGHCPEHVEGVDILVYSAAVPQDSPEVARARELELTVLSRSHMLAHLMEDHKAVSVVGSHGKTTTTWLISHVLMETGLDPTVMLGGNVSAMNGNFRWGSSEWFVSEIDESDGLPEVSSHCAILTNIDNEHIRWHGSVKNLINAFHGFLSRVRRGGSAVVCADNDVARGVAEAAHVPVITYGTSEGTDFQADNVEFDAESSTFDVVTANGIEREFQVCMPGMHNVRNSLGCIAAASFLGVPIDGIRHALKHAPRVERRLNVRKIGDITVVDDYGHHPTEIEATLDTVKAAAKGRVLCVFQPHRYTRTADLMEEFRTCFAAADRLFLMPVYPANESPIPGVSSEGLAGMIEESSDVDVEVVSSEDAPGKALEECSGFSVVIFLGAGDIVEAANDFVERLGQGHRE